MCVICNNFLNCHFTHLGGDDEICPYATFHLLGFREEMDPQQAGNNFQTFPYQNGHGSHENFVNTPASRSMVGDSRSLLVAKWCSGTIWYDVLSI